MFYMYRSGGGEAWFGPPSGMTVIIGWQELAAYQGTFGAPGPTGDVSTTASFVLGTDGTEGGAWLGALAPP